MSFPGPKSLSSSIYFSSKILAFWISIPNVDSKSYNYRRGWKRTTKEYSIQLAWRFYKRSSTARRRPSTHRDDKQSTRRATAAGPQEEVPGGVPGSFSEAGRGPVIGTLEPLKECGRRRRLGRWQDDAGEEVANDGVERKFALRGGGANLDLDRTGETTVRAYSAVGSRRLPVGVHHLTLRERERRGLGLGVGLGLKRVNAGASSDAQQRWFLKQSISTWIKQRTHW